MHRNYPSLPTFVEVKEIARSSQRKVLLHRLTAAGLFVSVCGDQEEDEDAKQLIL